MAGKKKFLTPFKIGAIAYTVVFIGLPLIRFLQFFRSPNYTDLSEKIGQHYPEVSDDLTNAIEISEVEDDYFSKTLTAAAIDRAYKKVENLDLSVLQKNPYIGLSLQRSHVP